MTDDNFNGPGRELDSDTELIEELVYCVQCGTAFVWDRHRDCPTCALAEMVHELNQAAIEAVDGEDESEIEPDWRDHDDIDHISISKIFAGENPFWALAEELREQKPQWNDTDTVDALEDAMERVKDR